VVTALTPTTFELPPNERARYQFAIMWSLGVVALVLWGLKWGIDEGAFELPFVLGTLALIAIFVWGSLLPVLSSSARVVLHEHGVEATTTYGRRIFVPWSELERLNLRPVAIGRRRAELRLIDRQGRARVLVTGHVGDFDSLVRLVEERLGARAEAGPRQLAASSDTRQGLGWRQVEVLRTAAAPTEASRALADALAGAGYVEVHAGDEVITGSSGWLDVRLTPRPERRGSVVQVSARDGIAPRSYRLISFVLLVVAGIAWFAAGADQPLVLLVLVGAQLISLVLVDRVSHARARDLVIAVRDALPS
jgi:hypothetical protein